MGESDTLYHELVTFLSSPRTDLRKAAAEATLATLTAASSFDASAADKAARRLASSNALKPLCRIASEGASSDEAATTTSATTGSNNALAALSMLCSHNEVGNNCVLDFIEECNGVGRMLEIALSSPPPLPNFATTLTPDDNAENSSKSSSSSKELGEWRRRVNYACALLANATRTENGVSEFIGLSFPDEAVPSSSSLADIDEDEEKANEKRDTSKSWATLLLSWFLNPAFVDVSSPAYKAALESFDGPKRSSAGLDEYNSDLDDKPLLDEDDGPVESTSGAADASQSEKPHNAIEPTRGDGEYYDPYQHVAAVMTNVTQLETGRKFLMRLIHRGGHSKKTANGNSSPTTTATKTTSTTTSTSHLESLLPQLSSPNLRRRRGIAGALKNCCLSVDLVWWLFNVVQIDKSLLLPLVGPEELTIDEVGLDPDYWLLGPQKKREPDASVRKLLVEALLFLLASRRRARETLWERRAYVIIKLADMVEEDEEVTERLLEIVQYLRRDEEGTEEGSSDRWAYERYARGVIESDGARNSDSGKKGARGGDDVEEDYNNID